MALPALVAVTVLAVSHASSFAIRGSVIASGGTSSTPAGNATRRAVGTAGQPMVGWVGAGQTELCSGFWRFGATRMTSFGPEGELPKAPAFSLLSANPTTGTPEFELALPRASRVTITVLDVSGRRIGDPLEQRLEAGRSRLTWGAQLRHSGVYFFHVTTEDGFEAKRKIVLVR